MIETRPIELVEAELVDGARDLADTIREIGKLEMVRADKYEAVVPHLLNGGSADLAETDANGLAAEFNLLRLKERELQIRMSRLWTEHGMRKPKK